MSLQVVALDRSDIPAYARVELEAFKSHPRTPMVWTKGYTPAVYAYNESGKQKGFGDPAEHSLKCFDTRTGQMVAGATYSFVFTEADGVVHAVGPPEPVKEDAPPPANWPEGGNWAITRFYKINTPKVIQQHLGGQPYICKLSRAELAEKGHQLTVASAGQSDCLANLPRSRHRSAAAPLGNRAG